MCVVGFLIPFFVIKGKYKTHLLIVHPVDCIFSIVVVVFETYLVKKILNDEPTGNSTDLIGENQKCIFSNIFERH